MIYSGCENTLKVLKKYSLFYALPFNTGCFFFDDPISFSCHFYTNKDIDMRFFVTCSWHRVIFLYFFRYCMIIFQDGTKDTKRGKFQVTGCQNVITLSQDVPFFFWQPVCNVLPFLYKWCYWHAVFCADQLTSCHFVWYAIHDDPINSYRDTIIHVKVKGHQYVIILWLLTFLTQDTWSMLIKITNIKDKCIQ